MVIPEWVSLENPSKWNASYYYRAFTMGNNWTYIRNDDTWKKSLHMGLQFRAYGGNPHALQGRTYQRKDMVEALGGGCNFPKQHQYDNYLFPVTGKPVLPSLALISQLNEVDEAYVFTNAVVGASYSTSVTNKIVQIRILQFRFGFMI